MSTPERYVPASGADKVPCSILPSPAPTVALSHSESSTSFPSFSSSAQGPSGSDIPAAPLSKSDMRASLYTMDSDASQHQQNEAEEFRSSSASLDLEHPTWLDPLSRFRWHRAHDPVYQHFSRRRPAPHRLLPNNLMTTYRRESFWRETHDMEPSIPADLVGLHEALETEWWEGLRLAQEVDGLGFKVELPKGATIDERGQLGAARQRWRNRYDDVMWLDVLWTRCVAFEAEHGVEDIDRVRRRFKRFKVGHWSTLEERGEAERREERNEG